MTWYLTQKGIEHQTTVPYTPEQNSVEKRGNCTIQETKYMLHKAELPDNY